MSFVFSLLVRSHSILIEFQFEVERIAAIRADDRKKALTEKRIQIMLLGSILLSVNNENYFKSDLFHLQI